MRKLVYYVAATIDGFIAGPQGEFDFFPVPDDISAAIFEELPETVPTHIQAALGLPDRPHQRFDTVLMGRGTYEPALREGITSPYAHLRQLVFSTSLPSDQDPAVEIVRDRDPVEVVRELKQQDSDSGSDSGSDSDSDPGGKDIWLAGGGKLAAELLPEIDELVVKRSPRVACAGIPLFDGTFTPTAFTPVSTRNFASGVSMTTYVQER
ncbi:dihydrofolate reductase [Streptomyces oryzae]|uniref:Dihydrofolate reductase n=1 Tax=Streptomyces oryzae TaxID=1434886 RepID=A0ABS3XDV6_9ACTN|nr:dihydrofolate reductase [Streptomyces oryzae]MBO8193555.1 dihydrofolate reductase [Streptomyces oryzae]